METEALRNVRNQMENLALNNPALEAYIKVLARNIIPSDEYVAYGNSVVSKVFELLKTKSKYAVDRVYIAGSAGKHTSIIKTDFDCAVFVNEEEPLFCKVLEDFEVVLDLTDAVKIENIRKSKFSLQFNAGLHGKQYIEIDLVPATNFLEKGKGHANMLGNQAWKTLLKIKENPRDGYKYSSSLSEASLDFIRQQSGFIHDLIRLAKFWNKTLHIEEYVSGRSSLIELIAIDAGQKEEQMHRDNKSLLRGFQIFLHSLAGFDTLEIHFKNYNPLKGEPGNANANEWRHALGAAKHTVPFVVDPANPYNNFIKSVKRHTMEKFQRFAGETLHRMGNATCSLHMIFEPQPKVILPPKILEEFSAARSPMYLVDTVQYRKELQPTMIIRNEKKMKARFETGYLKFVQTCFMTNIHSYVNTGSAKTSGEVQNRVTQSIESNIMGGQQNWVPSSDPHETYDVTFIIPYLLEDVKNFAMISLKWA